MAETTGNENTESTQTTYEGGSTEVVQITLPSEKIWKHAAKLAITDDKPILLDYWMDSLNKKAIIGVREGSEEKLLVKSEEEYTSTIAKIFKVDNEFIIVTENSIYLVSANIATKRIS